MAGYVVPPGGGQSFGPGINVKVEHGPARILLSSKVSSRPCGRAQVRICTGPTTRRSTSLTARSCSRWTGRNTSARPGPLSLSREAAATASRIGLLTPPGSCRWRHRVPSAWSKNSSSWSGLGNPERKQISTMRQWILRQLQPCMHGTAASWSRTEDTAGHAGFAAAPEPGSLPSGCPVRRVVSRLMLDTLASLDARHSRSCCGSSASPGEAGRADQKSGIGSRTSSVRLRGRCALSA
jgi:hypothetical protein